MRTDFKIVAHRGTASGLIPENTAESAQVALLSGADVIELDTARTVDGVFLAIHDTLEPELLGVTTPVTELTAAQVAELPFLRGQRAGERMHVQTLAHVLDSLRGSGAEIHIDRGWRWWPELLPLLDELDLDDQVLIKVPADRESIAALEAAEPRQRVVPILRAESDVAGLESCRLNLDVIELVAGEPESALITASAIKGWQARAYRVMANAEIIGLPLFGGYDDEMSIFVDPSAGWGRLAELDVDLIQTDFPWLLAAYRAQLAGRPEL